MKKGEAMREDRLDLKEVREGIKNVPWQYKFDFMNKHFEPLLELAEKQRDALEFYADKKNYENRTAFIDNGRRARAALEGGDDVKS